MTTPNQEKHGYLSPVLEVFYPDNPSEFRGIYQQPNPRAPEYRFEGLCSMTDEAVQELASALRLAHIENPAKVNELWSAVCTQGWMATHEASA